MPATRFRLSGAHWTLIVALALVAMLVADRFLAPPARSGALAASDQAGAAKAPPVLSSKLQLIATASDPLIGTLAPDFALPDAAGKRVRLSEVTNRPLVLNFLADSSASRSVWKLERQQILNRYGNRVVVVTVAGSKSMRPPVREAGANYESHWLYSSDPRLRNKYHALSCPRTWVLGSRGFLRQTHAAGAPPAAIVKQASDALGVLVACIPIDRLPGQQASQK